MVPGNPDAACRTRLVSVVPLRAACRQHSCGTAAAWFTEVADFLHRRGQQRRPPAQIARRGLSSWVVASWQVSGRQNHPIPVSVGAHDALMPRLEAIATWLPKAAQSPEADIEYVHQLRVSTRKAGAALKLFRELLPKKRARRLKDRLKSIRRAAGEARDLDVLLERLTARAENEPGLLPLVRQLTLRRAQAQGALIDAWRATADGSLALQGYELLERLRWRGEEPEPALHDAAVRWLRPIIKGFFAKAPRKGRRVSIERLHRFRIATKHLRYALDLMAAAWPADQLAKTIKQIRSLQQRLGELNDHHAAMLRFQAWLAEYKAGAASPQRDQLAALIEAEIAWERKQLRRSVSRFFRWWSDERRDRLRRRLKKLLA